MAVPGRQQEGSRRGYRSATVASENSMTANPEPPPMMDLTGFTDPDTSLALAARGCPEAYTAIAKRHMAGQEHLTPATMLFGSFVSRMRGLHEAIVREIEAN